MDETSEIGGSRVLEPAIRRPWRRLPLLLAAALVAFAAYRWIGPERVHGALATSWHWLEAAPPLVFFGSMALLCLLPVPITLFYVSAGPIYGIVPALLWILPAVALNQFLGHRLANGILRPRIERLIESHGYTVPTVHGKTSQSLFTTVIRITPGFPYFLQNLILGIAGVEWTRHLLISLPIQMFYATGFVVLGRSAFEGRIGVAAGALVLLVLVSVVARLVHARLRSQAPSVSASVEETGPSRDPSPPASPSQDARD
jgi:uncharacterized membrane protein YdjX (TVP38/TMEM64 family)